MYGALMKNSRPSSHTAVQKSDPRAGKYLTFRLAKEEYAIRVANVREIMGIQEITVVPQTPPFVKGVINLRGKVIPIVDLRLKFGLPDTAYNSRTCIVVVQLELDTSKMMVGAIVDSVSEVGMLQAGDIEDVHELGNGLPIPYLMGVAKSKGKVKILLDIDAVLNAPELSGLDSGSR